MVITREQAAKLVQGYDSTRAFSVTFIKRSTGEVRLMNCMRGVTKHLKGGELTFDPSSKGLLVVFDLQKRAYRMVNLETVLEIKMDGKVYKVQ